jgi:hypothetical protein
MSRLLVALTACLVLSGVCEAADKLYLSRTLQIEFNPPGKLTRIDAAGATPVAEEMHPNSFVLILPKRINLRISIGLDNDENRRRLIGVRVQDELAPAQKTECWITPVDVTKMLWLDAYRVQITMVSKDGDLRGFIKATIKIDVYAPEPKKP